MAKPKSDRISLHVYIDRDVDTALREMSGHHGDYAHIVREVLRAFVDSRKTATKSPYKEEN